MKALLLLLKGAKLGKVGITGGTMVLSTFTYAWLYGWPYAVGLVALIFCHEMGHYAAARRRGLPVGAMTFVPFVGAWVQLGRVPHDAETEAHVGIAGPLAGTMAALLCYVLARAEGSRLLLALAYAGCMINLFNLIPLARLDGGRITAVISPKAWWVGLPVLIGLFLWRPSPMLLLVGALALPSAAATLTPNGGARAPGCDDVPITAKIQYACWYFGLAALLGTMTFQLYQALGGRGGA